MPSTLWCTLVVPIRTIVALRHFLNRVPNGQAFRSLWPALGHVAPHGDQYSGSGFPRNKFGEDFKMAGFRWTKGLCEKDSDGDGLSNGAELNDPACIWSPGSTPSGGITNLSHPGLPHVSLEGSTAYWISLHGKCADAADSFEADRTTNQQCTPGVLRKVAPMITRAENADLTQLSWNGRGEQRELDAIVAAAHDEPEYLRDLHPHFRSQYRRVRNASCASRRPQRTAVLLSGAVRTMLTPASIAEFSRAFSNLRRLGGAHLFAYVSLDSVIEHRGDERHRSRLPKHPPVTLEEVRSVMRSWGLAFALREHQDDRSYRLRLGSCRPRALEHQIAKVMMSHAMMLEEEARRGGVQFDRVLRLRPDACMDSAHLWLRYALDHTACASRVVFMADDAFACYPRWAAEAYAAPWRVDWPAVPVPPAGFASGSVCDAEAGSVTASSIVQNARVLALNLNRFWALSHENPRLRRWTGCVTFN